MKIDWTPVTDELTLWRQAGLTLPVWWRDDDAIAPTPALEQLVALSKAVKVPVHLAVIPKAATPELAARVADTDHLIPVVHGWTHRNLAPKTAKKAEFGDTRDLADVALDVQNGLKHLQSLFGPRLKPMFVPPWNRIAPVHFSALAKAGYTALSTYTPRSTPFAAPDLQQINTHLDPINWRAGKTLIAPDQLVAQLADLLIDRRTGKTDNNEPLGLLTHHLVHDTDVWEFTRQMLETLTSGPITLYRHP